MAMLCENFVTFGTVNPYIRPISFKDPIRLIQNKGQSMSFAFPWQAISEKQKGLLLSKPASSCQNHIDRLAQFWTENTLFLTSLWKDLTIHAMYTTMSFSHGLPAWNDGYHNWDLQVSFTDRIIFNISKTIEASRSRPALLELSFLPFLFHCLLG